MSVCLCRATLRLRRVRGDVHLSSVTSLPCHNTTDDVRQTRIIDDVEELSAGDAEATTIRMGETRAVAITPLHSSSV